MRTTWRPARITELAATTLVAVGLLASTLAGASSTGSATSPVKPAAGTSGRTVPDVVPSDTLVDDGPLLTASGAASGSAASHYGFLSRQSDTKAPIARWNPCAGAIGYRVSSVGGGRGATAEVKGAIARIRQVTGLPLVYRGQTRVVP